ncbi:hypothetical protein ACMFMG_011993 [Clarireedia jacksonii]
MIHQRMIGGTQPQTRRGEREPETEDCFVGAGGTWIALRQNVENEAGEEGAEKEGDGMGVDIEGFVVQTESGAEGSEERLRNGPVGGVNQWVVLVPGGELVVGEEMWSSDLFVERALQ